MTRTKNILLLFILFCTTMTVSAHQDFYVVSEFGNVKTRIKTGFKYEEIKKVEIIGELAKLLAEKLDYNEPILLDFNHYYVGISEPIYFLGFSKGPIHYNYRSIPREQTLLNKKGIVIRQSTNEFNILNTLKLLEYSIINWKKIKIEQRKREFKENYCDWTLTSINPKKAYEILKLPESKTISEVKMIKIYRKEEDFKSGLTYYWQNDKYNFVFIEGNEETFITSLSGLYDLQRLEYATFIFETRAEFIVFDSYKREIVSKKWEIKNAEKNFRLYEIKHIGGDKYSISFYYRNDEPGIQPKNQILIYAKYEDKLIQDLNKLIDE